MIPQVGAPHKMKGFGVTLVLLFLAGTAQARHFWQQDAPPPSPVERLKEQFHNYLESAKTTAREMVAQLDASNFGQRFELDLGTKAEMVAAVAEQLREQLSPDYQAIRERLHSDFQEMTADLAPIRAKIKPLLDELNDNLQGVGQAYYEKLTPVVQEWQQSAREDMELLRTKMEPITAHAGEKVQAVMADFRQKMVPYMDEMRQVVKQKVQHVHAHVVPRMKEWHNMIQAQMSNLREAMDPVVQGLRVQLVPAMKNLEERLVSLLATVQRNLEQQSPQQS